MAWVRLGVFLFEQLPKKLLDGLTPCRWRPHAEGSELLAPVLLTRRVILKPGSHVKDAEGFCHIHILSRLSKLSASSGLEAFLRPLLMRQLLCASHCTLAACVGP